MSRGTRAQELIALCANHSNEQRRQMSNTLHNYGKHEVVVPPSHHVAPPLNPMNQSNDHNYSQVEKVPPQFHSDDKSRESNVVMQKSESIALTQSMATEVANKIFEGNTWWELHNQFQLLKI